MRNIAVTLSKLFVLCEYFLAAYNSRHASLRLFGRFVVFFTKIIILAERTQFAFRNEAWRRNVGDNAKSCTE
jgi:hypothetical protein